MYAIGVVPVPADFKYLDVLKKGRPQHDRFDPFSLRHPRMDCGKRAKIFAPFDALRGFNFAISRREVLYVDKPELGCEQQRELNCRLDILHNLTFNSRMARLNRVVVTVTYFCPCSDEQHEAYGNKGKLKTIKGICKCVDTEVTQTICVDDHSVCFSDLIWIESTDHRFQEHEKRWNDCYEIV